ncbi:hypothetical protein NW762_007874 [Fusarium torreyae]|uniref:Extracellular membrane protein CFEM domain-containing protein n=1 Tax=Fusarium torreyae TaxID=1237075 RepID=A0A9W8RZQ3_9HYPO|nr:hypothetical protein NW762_007874 [Fusarium torreyae]
MASRWFTILLLLTPTLALENDFYLYPKGAQSCLSKNADDASCTGKDAKEMNYCLCGLGSYKNDFILGSARCIGDKSPNDVDETYDTMKTSCDESSTPMKVTKKQFQDAAHEGETTTTSAGTTGTSATATGTAAAATTTSSDSEEADTGLSTGATAGVAVGAAAGGAAVLGLFVWLWLHRRKKNAAESQPMLPNYENGNGASPYPGTAASPYHPTEPKPAWSEAGTPHPSQGWGTPDPNAGYYVPQKHGAVPVELPPDTVAAPNPVYEMDGTTAAPIEMPGSTPIDGRSEMPGSTPVDARPESSHIPPTPQTLPVSPQTLPATPHHQTIEPHRT